MKRRILSYAALLMAAMLCFSACGGGTGESTAESTEEKQTEAATEKVTEQETESENQQDGTDCYECYVSHGDIIPFCARRNKWYSCFGVFMARTQ